MDRYAVIGNPIEHSLSPDIHRAFAAETGERLRYDKLPAPADGFADLAEAFFAQGGCGLNVTLPFKGEACRWVAQAQPAAARCGAVNTIALEGGRTLGFNTDGIGLVRDLEAQAVPITGRRLLLIGAGGAVSGILDALVEADPASVRIANRTLAKAEALAERHGATVAAAPLEGLDGRFDLIINGTSVGVSDSSGDFGGAGGLIAPALAVGVQCYDLFYRRDGQTPFCCWAKRAGAAWVSDGLGMLVEQAAAAFAIWRGRAPSTRDLLRSLRSGTAQ
ncbi:MAG: shikimate dehydrogenase [Gammaproteobacteria bacterium]|nr:shikimate dehydrogenase [Gammaproteobacteria bacterium]